MSEKHIVKEMYCFVAENIDGEGIMGFRSHQGWVPMVGSDLARVKSLYPIAVQVAALAKLDFKVLKFTGREDITELAKVEDLCVCASPQVILGSPPKCERCRKEIKVEDAEVKGGEGK